MSATKITQTRYECRCELAGCPGNGKSWISEDDHIPERCRFCGRRTWNGNLKRARLVTAFGRTQRVSEWAKESGISKALIRSRILSGWEPEKAVSLPPKN